MESAIKTRILLGQETSESAKPVLFKEWAKTYLELEAVKMLRSYQDRVEIMACQLVPFFGAKILSEIRPADVEAYRGQRTKRNGTKASPQTINNDHIVLKHVLNVAIRRGLLASNPAARVPMPDPQNERDRVLTEEEWERLYQVAKPHLKPVLIVAYQLGQRMSEVVGLTWDRVDLKRGFITLRSIDTKTKTARQVPMTPDVKATLHGLAKVRSLATRHVFLYKREPLRDFRTAFRTAMTEAGVSGFRFHDLRHCAATNLRRAGVDTTTAMQIVGHTSPQMWKRYNHIQEADLTQAANKLGKYLQGNTPGTLDGTGESG
jgi:integrase